MANSSNVSTGKPLYGGSTYVATSDTATVPTAKPTGDAESIPTGFASVGYLSEDGVEMAIEVESEPIKAFGGDVVDESQTSYAEKFTFAMIERNETSMKVFWGDSNVTASSGTVSKVMGNSKELPTRAWVFDYALKNGKVLRVVVPKGKVTNREAIKYKDGEVVAYKVTLSAFPDASGNMHYEYT